MPVIAHGEQVLLALEPRPESARLVRRALDARGLSGEVAHGAALLATEVVGNAVRHAGMHPAERIVFFATVLNGGRIRIQVADAGPGFDPDTVQTDGYGLALLDQLASRWGVDIGDRGCRVWFEVDPGQALAKTA
jgi:anti-sigma regulatory factor (Ser/Thr protein kinase)